MELVLYTSENEKTGTLRVADSVFSVECNDPLIHQVLTSYYSSMRASTKAQKSRSKIRGSGKKPWRQKGTGRARAGTSHSPLWRGGGVTFAAETRNYSKKINKKMYRSAICSMLSELVRQNRFICVEEFDVTQSKTKLALAKLAKFNADNALIVTETLSDNLFLSVRNIPKVAAINVSDINPDYLFQFEKLLFTKAAVAKLEVWLS